MSVVGSPSVRLLEYAMLNSTFEGPDAARIEAFSASGPARGAAETAVAKVASEKRACASMVIGGKEVSLTEERRRSRDEGKRLRKDGRESSGGQGRSGMERWSSVLAHAVVGSLEPCSVREGSAQSWRPSIEGEREVRGS